MKKYILYLFLLISGLSYGQTNSGGTRPTAALTDYTTLPFSATVNWDARNIQSPLALTTATSSFTLNITNLVSGSFGRFKLYINTTNAVNIAFAGSGLTFKSNNAAIPNYTLPVGTGKSYDIWFQNQGGEVQVMVFDFTSVNMPAVPVAIANNATPVAIPTSTYTKLSFQSVVRDPANMLPVGTPTRIVVPGTGAKEVHLNVEYQWVGAVAGRRRVILNINGVRNFSYQDEITPYTTAASTITATSAFRVFVNGGDYIEIEVFQDSGVSLNLNTSYFIIDSFTAL